MSIARPRACDESRVVPFTERQLNAEVLSASIDSESEFSKRETGCTDRSGNADR